MIGICPRCQRRFITEDTNLDFIHECNSGQPTLDNEDVVIVGNWDDYTGSGIELNVNMLGTENKLFGTKAGIEGEDDEDRTRRGKRTSTHRTRQHIEFIKLKGGC
jgi:hypothetical protein